MSDLFAALSSEDRAGLKRQGHPDWVAPMLATLTDEPFSDADWIYERKLDGERVLAFRDGDRVRLMTRNRNEIGATYPELVEALAHQPCRDFVADGEVVAFDGAVTSFSRLQTRMQKSTEAAARASGVAVKFYLFDLLHLEGRGLERLPLRSRKALLKRALAFADPIRFTPHRNGDGVDYHREACAKGWEGVLAKDGTSSYRHARSRDWLKFKCTKGQELVIGGFTEPKGSRVGFGALLVGHFDGEELRYAGRVGTGFDDDQLRDLKKRMDGLARKTSPFVEDVPEKGVTWLSPKLVGEFGFTEWTRAGRLRHPRFLGLRRDKRARDVVREKPEA